MTSEALTLFLFGDPVRGPLVRASRFAPPAGAVEAHLCLSAPPASHDFAGALSQLTLAYAHACERLDLPTGSAVLRRFFLSDAANQEQALFAHPLARSTPDDPVAISVVEQPPLPEGRLALWAWHVHDRVAAPSKQQRSGGVFFSRPSGGHLLTTALRLVPAGAAGSQTRALFECCLEILAAEGATLRDHVLRTWLFVHGVDLNYAEMVAARAELFSEQGLNQETHYIASTGIEGRRADPRALIQLEAYALSGLDPRQIRFLSAPEQLGPTSAYGVTFERGTAVAYGDRRHLVISGTASIDNQGAIVALGDIRGQMARTFANIAALLEDGGASFADVVQMIVYLRDPADRSLVDSWLDSRLPRVPRILVQAPVCRPGWLIEAECWAITEGSDGRFPPF